MSTTRQRCTYEMQVKCHRQIDAQCDVPKYDPLLQKIPQRFRVPFCLGCQVHTFCLTIMPVRPSQSTRNLEFAHHSRVLSEAGSEFPVQTCDTSVHEARTQVFAGFLDSHLQTRPIEFDTISPSLPES